MAVYVNINRDSSKDIISKPEHLYAYTNQNASGETLYTDTTTLTTGMTLYDNTGTDTGLKVGTVSGDSFEVESNVTITFVPYSGAGAWSGSYEGTVNDISFISAPNGCTPNTFLVAKSQPCTIKAKNTTSKGNGMILADSAGNQVAYGSTTFEYTFTPTEDCTFEIGANIEP